MEHPQSFKTGRHSTVDIQDSYKTQVKTYLVFPNFFNFKGDYSDFLFKKTILGLERILKKIARFSHYQLMQLGTTIYFFVWQVPRPFT